MNVLVALAWPNHIHHARARAWFSEVHPGGWATCPVTESGFVRVSSNARVIPDARSPGQAIHLLGRMRALPGHEFWSDDVSPLDDDAAPYERAVGYRHITDAHLLTLAMRRNGRLATFDRGIEELVEEPREVVERIP